MRYAKFERIVILLIAIAIAAMSIAMIVQKTDGIEVFGHALMIVIIVSSLYWNRKGALASFLLCFGTYTAMRLAWRGDFTAGTAVQLIAAKLLIYLLLAFICIYMRSQFRYFFVKMESQDLIDDETQIGNERFLLRELTARIDENERYETPFSIVTIRLDEEFLRGMQAEKGVSVLRDISTSILKSDTRSVDELARDGSSLVVILPCVGREGAQVCGKRLEEKVRRYLEQHLQGRETEKAVSLDIYQYPEDKGEIGSLVARLSDAVTGTG